MVRPGRSRGYEGEQRENAKLVLCFAVQSRFALCTLHLTVRGALAAVCSRAVSRRGKTMYPTNRTPDCVARSSPRRTKYLTTTAPVLACQGMSCAFFEGSRYQYCQWLYDGSLNIPEIRLE